MARGDNRKATFDQRAAVLAFMHGDSIDAIALRLGISRKVLINGIRMINTWRALEWLKQPVDGWLPPAPASAIQIDPDEKIDVQRVLNEVYAWLNAMKGAITDPTNSFSVKDHILYGVKVTSEIRGLVDSLLKVKDFVLRIELWDQFRLGFTAVIKELTPATKAELLTVMRRHSLLPPAPPLPPKEITG